MERYEQIEKYNSKKARLQELLSKSSGKVSLQKKTASNLFRYMSSGNQTANTIKVSDFDSIIAIDSVNLTLDVEGLTSYEKIIAHTLQYGLLPTVAPELKHITIGGATVGIGIESSGHQYGFVHDGLLEAEVLLPDGRIILCNDHNEHADLFFALPNSYGTLGYILRAKIKLYRALPFVHLAIKKFSEINDYLAAMEQATVDKKNNFVEGLVFSKNELYLITSTFTTTVDKLDSIYQNVFYKLIQTRKDIYLTTEDYIFRYDPDWFWNIPETPVYNLFRKIAPKSWRNSGFYKRYIDTKKNWLTKLNIKNSAKKSEEPLIQDWEVPWERAEELLRFALDKIDLNGKPWAIVPIQSYKPASLYPLKEKTLYFNLGCYCYSKSQNGNADKYFNTKMMDEFCFGLGGLKMLYSSTFLSKEKFDDLYNGKMYQSLKQKYDPQNLRATLYDKVVAGA